MNPFKGLGAVLIVFLAVLAVSHVSGVSMLILVASIAIVAVCMVTLLASARRRHRDRLVAFGRVLPADWQPDPDWYEPVPEFWTPQPSAPAEEDDAAPRFPAW